MGMATIELSLYEALTEIGVNPDAARKVERQMESAITTGQETVRAQMHQQLMTKANGEKLKVALKGDIAQVREDMLKAINTQTWKLITVVTAANGVMLGFVVATIKLL